MSTSPYSSDPSQTAESSGTATPVDEEAVLRAKQEIQTLVQEVVELSRSEVEPVDFFSAAMDKSVSALAAIGGAVWMKEENGPLRLEYQVNLRQTGLAESEADQIKHGRLLQQTMTKGDPVLIPPHSGTGDEEGEQQAANPTAYLLIVAPIKTDRGVEGAIEIFQRPGTRLTTQRGYLRFLVQISELAGEFLKTRRLRHFTTKQSLWEQLEAFTSLVHKGLNSRETAYTISNEGRRLIGCDRVTVVLKKGSKYHVEAISGQDTFDKRSNVVRLLRNLATTVGRTGDDLWFSGDTADLAPQVEKAVNAYVDEAHTKQLAVLPLRESDKDPDAAPEDKKLKKRENILGAIIIEQLVDSRPPEGMEQRIDVVRRHSVSSLSNAQEFEGLFLLPLWRTIGKTRVLVTARNLPKTLLATVAIGAAIFAMCTIPYDFTVVSDGKLLPEVRRYVFASLDGTVVEVPVNHGDYVEEGQMVARQKSIDLESQITALHGDIRRTRDEIASKQRQRDALQNSPRDDPVEREQVIGQLTNLRITLENQLKQMQLLDEKAAGLIVKSPIAGRVVTWKVRESVESATVRKGQRIMEVADTSSPWELEIFVPEAKMGHVLRRWEELQETDPEAKLPVTFILATHSAEHLSGQVEKIDTSAEVHGESGNTVRMTVSFPQEDLRRIVNDPVNDLKVGADVKAKILCGKRAIGYVWFHDLFEFIQSRILFRI